MEQQHRQQHVDWTSLPQPVLVKCFTNSVLTAFCTCKAFAKAIFACASEVKVIIRFLEDTLQESWQALAAVLQLAGPGCKSLHIDVKTEPRDGGSPTYLSYGSGPMPITNLMEALHQVAGCLLAVTKLTCKMLVLECPPHATIAKVFPNLRQVRLGRSCFYSRNHALPLAGCEQLQDLTVELWCGAEQLDGEHRTSLGALPWEQQLGQLPSLSALTVHHDCFFCDLTTKGLAAVRAQLTSFELHSAVHTEVRPEVYQAVASCTSLRRLVLSHSVKLIALLPKLTLLQDLTISSPPGADNARAITYGDDLMGALLQLTHLTSLDVPSFGDPQQSYAGATCQWKRVRAAVATPRLLARLPLHALSQPLRLKELCLCTAPGGQGGAATVADVQAAVDNLARSGQCVHCSDDPVGSWANIRCNPEMDAPHIAALLRTGKTLLPQTTGSWHLREMQMDAEVVLALREVLHELIRIQLYDCQVLSGAAWVQLGQLLSLQELYILGRGNMVSLGPASIMGFFMAACMQAQHRQGAGVPQVPRLFFHMDITPYDLWSNNQRDEVEEMLSLLGLPQDRLELMQA